MPAPPHPDTEWIMYGHSDGKGGFIHIYPHEGLVSMCGRSPIVKLRVSLSKKRIPKDHKEFAYLSWWKEGDLTPHLIQNCFLAFNMQFAYGVQAEIDRGKGIILRLEVEEIQE